jgi:hypothetical protein
MNGGGVDDGNVLVAMSVAVTVAVAVTMSVVVAVMAVSMAVVMVVTSEKVVKNSVVAHVVWYYQDEIEIEMEKKCEGRRRRKRVQEGREGRGDTWCGCVCLVARLEK